jgi:hypothetical protein
MSQNDHHNIGELQMSAHIAQGKLRSIEWSGHWALAIGPCWKKQREGAMLLFAKETSTKRLFPIDRAKTTGKWMQIPIFYFVSNNSP